MLAFEFNKNDELIVTFEIKLFEELKAILNLPNKKKANQLLLYVYLLCDRRPTNTLRDLDTAYKEEQCRYRAFNKKDIKFTEKHMI